MLKVNDQKKIREFVDHICEDYLDIDPVKVRFERNEGFTTETTRAVADAKKRIVYISPDSKLDNDLYFSLAHELRHIYQYDEFGDRIFASYKTAAESSDLTEYNLQRVEVDAHAFSAIVMMDVIGAKPLFQSMDASVKSAIESRMKRILEEEFDFAIPQNN